MNNKIHVDMVMHEDHVNDQYIMDIEDFLRYLNKNKLILVKDAGGGREEHFDHQHLRK